MGISLCLTLPLFFEYGALVMTNREGKYRFSYPANGSELRLKPNGICTDALSHISVCDKMTNTVHMLNKDGRFLLHLLILPSGINNPYNLSYDVTICGLVLCTETTGYASIDISPNRTL